ncbi:response regulator [Estrella lausannensis]|uniref:Two-component system, response regulator n=1 Tax=Estrella lausannensis TaxID=483423 RepID=A0A0H5E4H4_9BACT|nr:response regulator [Estrella lausannensis]CRX38110.1 Two-component system, response regulator [Estrella lausannensis]
MTKTIHILYAGNDTKLIGYVFNKLLNEKITFDICKSIEDAHEACKRTSYDVYLFDEQGGRKILDLTEEIRKKETTPSIIAIVAQSLEELDILETEAEKIDYILEVSDTFEDLDELLRKILPHKPSLHGKLADLKKRYDETIDDKITLLKNLTQQTQKIPEKLSDLRVEIHKMAGSAGNFGYAEAGDLCKALEREIIERLGSGTYTDASWLASLDKHINKIETAFHQHEIPTAKTSKTPLVYVVDDDPLFLDLLATVKEDLSIDLLLETNPESALFKVKQPEFNPEALIVSEFFKASTITGYEIVDAERKHSRSTQYVVLLETDTIDKRMEAMNKGAHYTFTKPVSAYTLLKTISERLEEPSAKFFKALVVDDDVDFCDYTAAVLEEIGAHVDILNDPTDLFTKLQSCTPDVLLLDVLLPKYDGLNLLKTIRQDITYKDLIIVLVTGAGKSFAKIDAYAENVDDIMFKPIDPKMLQKRITSLIDRNRSLTPRKFNQATGLYSYHELLHAVDILLKRTHTRVPYLALFEINTANKGKDSLPDKELMVFISNRLQVVRGIMTGFKTECYFVKEGQFAMVFEGEEIDVIESRLTNLLYQIIQDKPDLQISIKASIVGIGKEYKNAQHMMQTAIEVLSEAEEKEFAPVRIVHRLPKGVHVLKRHVMIIDPDETVLKILRQSFEARGLFVSTYCEGGDALKALLSSPENTLPSLIIMERKLPDMEGLDLYIKIKNRFRTTIPLIILTVYSSDKDISEGIKQGVLEYIQKPFNISLLVQKSLQAIF